MKRLFINILYIVLLVVAFAYMMVNYDMSSASYMNMCIIDYANKYGIAGIGMFLLVPSFVFSILAIVIQTPVKVKLSFVRDTLSLCAGVFC